MLEDKNLEPKNFLLVDDEALIREGLKLLLFNEPFVNRISEASNKNEFIRELTEDIEVVLMDFKLADTNGIELLGLAKKKNEQIKVIALTGFEGAELVLNLLKSGVNGIVFKLDGYKEIRRTIENVLQSGSYFTEKVIKIIQKNSTTWDEIPPVILNRNETDLLKAIAMGHTTKQIADLLRMTEATTETYRIRLIKKVNAPNTASLIAFAYRNGLL